MFYSKFFVCVIRLIKEEVIQLKYEVNKGRSNQIEINDWWDVDIKNKK